MRKVWYHQIWIQNYLDFIVSDLVFSREEILAPQQCHTYMPYIFTLRKSDFFLLVHTTISRFFWKCMEICQSYTSDRWVLMWFHVQLAQKYLEQYLIGTCFVASRLLHGWSAIIDFASYQGSLKLCYVLSFSLIIYYFVQKIIKRL